LVLYSLIHLIYKGNPMHSCLNSLPKKKVATVYTMATLKKTK
jgi:hypothetical protein